MSFTKDIAPIFAQKCLKCHGPEKPKGGYQLHTFTLASQPGDSDAPPLTAGQPGQSELFARLTTQNEDDRMPQKDDPLSTNQMALVERWINEGAKFDGASADQSILTLIPREPYPEPPDQYRFAMPITAIAFSPDGRELAVGGYHELILWDWAARKVVRRIKDLPQRIHAAAFSPDGQSLAVAGGAPGKLGEVTLLRLGQAQNPQILGTMPDVMLALCFSPDGKTIAAGGANSSIHLYDALEHKEIRLIQQHADWVMALAFSSDGKHLASASRDRSARIYNPESGELEISYNDHGAAVMAVAFADDGKHVITGGRDKRAHLWTISEAKKAGELPGFGGDVNQLLLAGDSVFSACSDKLVRQHRVKDKSLVRTYSGHTDWVYALAFHERTKRLATGSHDGEVRVWTVEDGKLNISFNAAPGFVTARSTE